jgi:hypothetical protein
MRTIQKQMRASRNIVATSIAAKMAQNVTDYPLWSALSDVEDYYTAGTLTTGVIDTSTTVGIQENLTRREKQDVQRMTLSARRSAVLNTSTAPIANPATFVGLRGGRVLNPNGRNEFEKNGLTPAMISKMERVVCLQPRTGTLTDALRTAVLQRLGIELTPDAAITNARATRITSLADSSCP